jgi:membrane protease YdiL (CAAX protease family)
MKPRTYPWLMLFSRITLFFLVQVLFALIFLLVGKTPAWENSANWWPLTVALADVVCLFLLIAVFRVEGENYWHLFRFERQHVWGDLLALLIITVICAPLTLLPNVALAQSLWGDSNATADLFYRPLPYWAVYFAIVAFPLLQGLTETPTYFGYVMPRFEKNGMNKWLAISLPALVLGLQHIAMPFLIDGRFILWRGLMFLPFAFFIGFVFHWRPRILPYFVIVHVLLNISTIIGFLGNAY